MTQNKYYGPDQPIKTQKEWDEVFDKQAQVIADTLKITLDQARVRQGALLASGILDSGHPDDPATRMMIDIFLTSPHWDNQPKHFGDKTPIP